MKKSELLRIKRFNEKMWNLPISKKRGQGRNVHQTEKTSLQKQQKRKIVEKLIGKETVDRVKKATLAG